LICPILKIRSHSNTNVLTKTPPIFSSRFISDPSLLQWRVARAGLACPIAPSRFLAHVYSPTELGYQFSNSSQPARLEHRWGSLRNCFLNKLFGKLIDWSQQVTSKTEAPVGAVALANAAELDDLTDAICIDHARRN
jgi:hypothetical protein